MKASSLEPCRIKQLMNERRDEKKRTRRFTKKCSEKENEWFLIPRPGQSMLDAWREKYGEQ